MRHPRHSTLAPRAAGIMFSSPGQAQSDGAPRLTLDIHTHSTFSDGVHSPEELLQMAESAGLAVYSLTDHDSLKSFIHLVEKAPEALNRIPFVFIPGTELTTDCRFGKFDLLYFFPHCAVGDFAALEKLGVAVPERFRGRRVTVADIPKEAIAEVQRLEEQLRGMRSRRLDRMKQMFFDFKKKYPEMRAFDWDEFCRDNQIDMETHTSPGTVGRPHLADYMIKKRVVPDRNAAFQHYLRDGLPCVKHSDPLNIDECLKLSAELHTFPIIAHSLMKSTSKILSAVDVLASEGLRGLEVYHRKHTPADRVALIRECERLGLVQSLGSDFHSAEAGHSFGVPEYNQLMPEEVKRALVEALISV